MVSAGFNEVLREAIEEVGDCRDRIFDLVDRKRRRNRCGTMTGIEGQESGSLATEKKRCVDSLPGREKYRGDMAVV